MYKLDFVKPKQPEEIICTENREHFLSSSLRLWQMVSYSFILSFFKKKIISTKKIFKSIMMPGTQ